MTKDLNEIISQVEMIEGTIKLSQTKLISEYKDPQKVIILQKLYDSSEKINQRMGTIINSIFHHKRMVFAMSRRTLKKLLTNDKNIETNTIDTRFYQKLLAVLINYKVLEVRRPPNGVQAGIYRLILPEICNIMYLENGKIWFDEQDRQALQWYDNDKRFEKEEPEEDTPEDKLLNECIKELRNE